MIQLFHELLDFLGRGLSFFYDLIPNYGIAIILLTAAVRLVMMPLTIKQTRSMQEMQKLQPQIKALQAKYKGGDRQKLNEEMMKLYKEHKVNPLGGCLPLVLQLPVFLALYRVFEGCGKKVARSRACVPGYVGVQYLPAGSALARAIHLGKAGFLGMNLGITPVAALHSLGLVHVLPYYALVFFMVATTWYQQKQITGMSTGQQAQQMQMVGKLMPLLLGVFSLNLPAGVSIYWVASNIWTIGQQRLMFGKTATAGAPAAAAGAAAAGLASRGGASPQSKATPKTGPKAGLGAAGKTSSKAAGGGTAKGTEKASPGKAGRPATAAGSKATSRAGRAEPATDTPTDTPAETTGGMAAGAGEASPNGQAKPSSGQVSRDGATNGRAEPKGTRPRGSSANKQSASSRPRNSNARKKRRR